MNIRIFYFVVLASVTGSSHFARAQENPQSPVVSKKEVQKGDPTTGDAVKAEKSEKELCGSLEVFEGDVQILDDTRTHLIELKRKAPLPCGCWISSNEGWVHVKHSAGPKLNLGAHSYVQLLGSRSKSEQVVIYQGQVYAEVGAGDGEFKLGSALGRVRVKQGKVVYLSGYTENSSSQLIVLEDSANFENRFEDSRMVAVKEGEMSELRFDLFRVIPQSPTPISVAALKPKLFDLRVDEKVQARAFGLATKRQERTLAEPLVEAPSQGVGGRKIASIPGEGSGSEVGNPAENSKSKKIQAQVMDLAKCQGKLKGKGQLDPAGSGEECSEPHVQKHLFEKMAPGIAEPEGLLFPGRGLSSGDFRPAPQLSAKELEEKQKLMKDIARIQRDER